MADQSADRDPPPCSDETTHLPPQPVHLKFPTIDLNTSLESLLSHSTPTASVASIIMAAPASPPSALEESWASLDIADLSHDDDDTQSVNTDPDSLVDLSSVHDTESAHEDESQDELGADEDRVQVISMLKKSFSRNSEQVGQPDQQDLSIGDGMADTTMFHEAQVQSSTIGITMENIKHSVLTSDPQSPFITETITMTISSQDLKPFDTPVRVCYYGSPYCSNTRDELLGKIGAALLAPTATTNSQTPTTSTCFNIVPTEFGPGSKPAFADLIPTQTQMTIDEVSVVLNPLEIQEQDTMHFALRRGVVLDSMLGKAPADNDCKDFQPNLLVIHLSQKDLKDRGSQFHGLRQLAYRHCWPTVVVADDDSFVQEAFDSPALQYDIQVTTRTFDGQKHESSIRPIDLDTFMTLDIAQLSRHIKHIMDYSLEKSPIQESQTIKHTIRQYLTNTSPRQYVLKLNQGTTGEPSNSVTHQSWIGEVEQLWSRVEGRKYVKDFMFTLIVMMLGIYIVSFSQNLSSKVNELVGQANSTSVSSISDGTATVTTTSAIAITTTPSTAIPASNQDVALYDPVLFDQMWHRLTGRPLPEQETDKLPKEILTTEQDVPQAEIRKQPAGVKTMFDDLTQWLVPRLGAWWTAGDEVVAEYLDSLHNFELRKEIFDLHRKLRHFYTDAIAKGPPMSLSSQKHLRDLVDRSRHVLEKTRWARKEKLEKLVAEQKSLLSHAQHQARQIVSAKKKKRTSFFKRGRRAAV